MGTTQTATQPAASERPDSKEGCETHTCGRCWGIGFRCRDCGGTGVLRRNLQERAERLAPLLGEQAGYSKADTERHHWEAYASLSAERIGGRILLETYDESDALLARWYLAGETVATAVAMLLLVDEFNRSAAAEREYLRSAEAVS